MLKLHFCIREDMCIPAEVETDPGLERWQDVDGREFGFSVSKNGQYWVRFHDYGTFVVQPGSWEAVGFLNEGVAPGLLRDMFFRLIAPWILQRQDWECLHASAVLTASGVVVFCGPSGRGKSTIARGCGDLGASLYADDAVPFLIRDGTPMAARMPQRLRLRGPAASWFSTLPARAANEHYGHEVAYDFEPSLRPISAIYWLEPMADVAERPVPVIERIPPLESFQLLLSQAYCLTLADAACNRKLIGNYLCLVRSMPVFRLMFPSGLDRIPDVLSCLENNQRQLSGT